MYSRLDFLLTPGYADAAGAAAPHSEDGGKSLGTQVKTPESELPQAQRHIIKRPRLTRLLDEAEARVLLLVAPAGYGKTTLAREWVTACERRPLWCQIESGAGDPASMANMLAMAVGPLLGKRETRVSQYLRASADLDPTAVAALLAEETPRWPDGAWLVLDDYHRLSDSEASEALVRAYVERTGAQVLITSRERPNWVTARTLLYGTVFELGQSALALTHAEAAQILDDQQQPSAALIALADGWPAVIGLASFLKTGVITRAKVPDAIHDFLAEELFDGLDADARGPLILLAFVDAIDRSLLASLLGDGADELIKSATRQGLMSSREADKFEIHPLVRTFLATRVKDVRNSRSASSTLVDLLIDTGRTDEAFSVIKAFGLKEKLGTLFQTALETTLADGRVATVERWVDWARKVELSEPVLLLAEAELFIRRGHTDAGEALAVTAAGALDDPRMRARAHLCAGRAAGLSDRAQEARSHFALALSTDDSLAVRQQAAWGQFISSAYLNDDAAFQGAYEQFTAINDVSPSHVLRLRQAEFIYASRHGNVSETVARLAGAESLLDLIDDPLPRTGFLNNLALGLTIAAHYTDAVRVARREAEEGARWHLDFVLPSAYFMNASAEIGLGAFAEASALIDRAEALSPPTDVYATALAATLKAKLHISHGRFDRALASLTIPFEAVRDDIRGELYGTLALALALAGRKDNARKALANARNLMILVETRVMACASEALLALSRARHDRESSIDELANAVEVTGNYDSLICALRGSDALLQTMVANPRGRIVVETAAVRSGDPTLCSSVDIDRRPARRQGPVCALTLREREVLQLVSEGFTNIAIGRRLFISPLTVKTHLQHIYEKLDVNSRTAAVTKARAAGDLTSGDLE